MATNIDLMHREIGKLYMEVLALRLERKGGQGDLVKATGEVGRLRQKYATLSAGAMEQEVNLIALNERLMGKKANGEYAATSCDEAAATSCDEAAAIGVQD